MIRVADRELRRSLSRASSDAMMTQEMPAQIGFWGRGRKRKQEADGGQDMKAIVRSIKRGYEVLHRGTNEEMIKKYSSLSTVERRDYRILVEPVSAITRR